jgi:hypothetical protein
MIYHFLGLYVKVALTEIEYLYFSLSPCVLPRVTGRTLLICEWFYHFCNPSRRLCTSHNWTYVLPADTMCTSRHHRVYFPGWTFVNHVYFPLCVLLVVIFCTFIRSLYFSDSRWRPYFVKKWCTSQGFFFLVTVFYRRSSKNPVTAKFRKSWFFLFKIFQTKFEF